MISPAGGLQMVLGNEMIKVPSQLRWAEDPRVQIN